jgi:ATP diphosphatase
MSRIEELIGIMARLRDPERGCPWDRVQTFHTIAPYTIEEAYEVADAIERENLADLVDELGDLLFQIVFYAQIARESGAFGFDDVVDAISGKMIRRHPHVFGDVDTSSLAEQSMWWEEMKAVERTEGGGKESLLDDIPIALPALTRAVKLQRRAARCGFDWPNSDEVFDKISVPTPKPPHEPPTRSSSAVFASSNAGPTPTALRPRRSIWQSSIESGRRSRRRRNDRGVQ